MREMREMTQQEVLEIMCAPEATDEPEEMDFIESDEAAFIENWITKELR